MATPASRAPVRTNLCRMVFHPTSVGPGQTEILRSMAQTTITPQALAVTLGHAAFRVAAIRVDGKPCHFAPDPVPATAFDVDGSPIKGLPELAAGQVLELEVYNASEEHATFGGYFWGLAVEG